MTQIGQIIDNPITREQLVFLQTAQDTNGALLEFDHVMKPHALTFPEHIHLTQEERFEVMAGSGSYSINGNRHQATPGTVIVVPPGIRHINVWNTSDQDELIVRRQIKPELGAKLFFETLFALARDGKTDKTGAANFLQLAVLAEEIEGKSYLAGMPILLQQVTFRLLAPLGRLVGYRARYPC